MNRKTRRKNEQVANRTHGKAKYSLHDVQRAMNIALEMRKLTKGHLFSKTLVNKNKQNLCTFCGATMKTRKMCDLWFVTFLDRLQVVLINPDYFKDNEIEALWLQNSDEYKEIMVPLNVPKKKGEK